MPTVPHAEGAGHGRAPSAASVPGAPTPHQTGPYTVILIAGGDADFNIESLLHRARERGVPVRPLLVGKDHHPSVLWDVEGDVLLVDGEEVRVSGAFLRYDVFTHMADPRPAVSFRAQAWYATISGWVMASDGVRFLNRDQERQMNKPYYLYLARRAGLEIPVTMVTNDMERLDALAAERRLIAKPVPGGGYTKPVEELLESVPRRDGRAAAPAIVQERLEQPEVRVYGIGGRYLPFAVRSAALDYRNADDTRVEPLPLDAIDPALVAGLGRLMDTLGMTYGAADFKTDPATGRLKFLEINSSPMFGAFDAASGFAVSDAILDFLTGPG